MSSIAIIPARGGSKRIPRKNIRNFLGKPIICYSIEAAIKSNLFDEIIVSTDDAEIAEIAIKYGAKVPFLRSENTSDDFATTYDVLEEVLLKLKELKIEFENTCCIYPCAPFINKNILIESFEKLTSYSSIVPIVPFSFPIQRSFKVVKGVLSYFHPEYEKTRSQDLEKAYHDAGQFYWCKTNDLLVNKSILNENTGYIELSDLEVQDIDNEIDWKLAELKYKLKNLI